MAAGAVETEAARWRAPLGVRALTTLRGGGLSRDSYASLNLGDHVGDDPASVNENRRRLRDALRLPEEPVWLRQVHGTRCVNLADAAAGDEADGSFTDVPGRVCAVLTADCLPLFICDVNGGRVGLFHVGWKGLAAGIVERAISAFADRGELLCWLGPAIGPAAFEVGPEVRDRLEAPGNADCFTPSANPGRWLADLYGLVAHRLRRGGVHEVSWNPDACTYSQPERYFSYRREPTCGRMASLIWIDKTRAS